MNCSNKIFPILFYYSNFNVLIMIINDIVIVYPGIYETKCHIIENLDNIEYRKIKVACNKMPVIFNNDMWEYGYIDISSIQEYTILHTKKSDIPSIRSGDILIKTSGRQLLPVLTTSELSGYTFTSSYVLIRPRRTIYTTILYDTVKTLIVENPRYTISDILKHSIEQL